MTSRLKSKLEISYQVVNDESNVKVIKNMNIAEVWWLRLRSVVVRIKCILRVVRLEGVFGAALKWTFKVSRMLSRFGYKESQEVADRMELQGKILNWLGWNEKQ